MGQHSQLLAAPAFLSSPPVQYKKVEVACWNYLPLSTATKTVPAVWVYGIYGCSLLSRRRKAEQ